MLGIPNLAVDGASLSRLTFWVAFLGGIAWFTTKIGEAQERYGVPVDVVQRTYIGGLVAFLATAAARSTVGSDFRTFRFYLFAIATAALGWLALQYYAGKGPLL